MAVLEEMRRLSAAEDFFRYLELPYDADVVNVARLHILRRMGEYLRKDHLEGLSNDSLRERCREHLKVAYADFVASSPLQERVFKVHRDAVKEQGPTVPGRVFVPLSSIK